MAGLKGYLRKEYDRLFTLDLIFHGVPSVKLFQDYQDFELILVDDGSPDTSGAICDEYAAKDSRIRVIHKENGGLSSARNTGIDAAAGDYLFFLDSDDVIHPDCLHILDECIRRTGAEISVGEFTRFTGDVPPAGCFAIWDENCSCKSNLQTLECFFDGRESLHSLVSACCKLWHRRLFDSVRFPVGRLFEDEFTTYQLYFKAERIAFSGIVLYAYFVNDDGITRNLTLEKRFDEYDAQWDLIACRNGSEPADADRKKRFEEQYTAAFRIARASKTLDFLTHYDYYVLAKPQWTLLWRIKRQLLLHLPGKE